eukprot:CAMPEP_0118676476 /NCGR_PEP_ID=MMETSP0800-20121206/2067_1 /TAXON_ID=210618 ORGANISM="Striatella unipunctata, Strain CCMP2910" /NCGR_SAMPLE_ID=MMETSP0800 /ASSEMBLY_ACC=CAM_ASM_000638 /LENGTH=139 /DNA_ID=CAMNT_0006571991 /DNA_START=206 /DNA_END=625 /DNA_ORIENTATION=+
MLGNQVLEIGEDNPIVFSHESCLLRLLQGKAYPPADDRLFDEDATGVEEKKEKSDDEFLGSWAELTAAMEELVNNKSEVSDFIQSLQEDRDTLKSQVSKLNSCIAKMESTIAQREVDLEKLHERFVACSEEIGHLEDVL